MKKEFLELIEEVKQKRIAEALYRTSNAEQLKEVWRESLDKNHKLCEKARKWAQKYKETGSKAIFEEGETIENPMQIVIIISIVASDYEGLECKIFERWEDLAEMVCMYDNDFAQSISYNIRRDYICNITAEQVFPKKENETGF